MTPGEANSPSNPARISLDRGDDVLFWTSRFKVTEPDLRDLVRRFGVSPRDVEDALGASATHQT